MFPATLANCPNGVNDFDPTVRPWYIAASSGPKDIILVLDTSGSMKMKGRLVSSISLGILTCNGVLLTKPSSL